MALFGKKKNTEVAAPEVISIAPSGRDVSAILIRSRITEKASMQQAGSVYTFDILESATKRDVRDAVRALYKVTPVKIALVTIPRKARRSMRTGKRGVSSGGRKAYVFLRKGDTITIS